MFPGLAPPSTLYLALAKAYLTRSLSIVSLSSQPQFLVHSACQIHLRAALKHTCIPILRNADGRSSVFLKAVPVSDSDPHPQLRHRL